MLAIVRKIVDQQFKLIGENMTYDALPEYVEDKKKKKIKWWDYYMFKDEEQYLKWKEWAIAQLKEHNMEKDFDTIDMTYGLNYRMVETQKEGQMALF